MFLQKINNFINHYSKFIVFALFLLMFVLGFLSLKDDSGTTDEVAHIPAGYAYLKFHDYRLNPEHPPLIKALAALPLQFIKLKFPETLPAWRDEINGQWETGWKFIYHWGNNPEKILILSRLPILILSLILGLFIYKWTKDAFGKKTALLALFFYVLCPNILAHSRLVTTDLGFTATFFIALYYFYKFLKSPSWKNLLLTALIFGLAQLSKFSNLVIIPYFVILSFVFIIFIPKIKSFPFISFLNREWKKRFIFFIFSLTFIFVFGFIVVNIGYYLTSYKTPSNFFDQGIEQLLPDGKDLASTKNFLHILAENPISRPFSWYLLGVKMVSLHLKYGHPTYFLGETRQEGWWYYYPVSFLLKTPISMIMLFALSIIYCIKSQNFPLRGIWRSQTKLPASRDLAKPDKTFYFSFKKWFNENTLEFISWSVIIMFFIIGITSKLNIGLRHILPLYPFLYILTAKYFVKIFLKNKTKIRLTIGGVLIAWYLLSNVLVFPHYLAYFNEFIGGYKNAYKYSVDSNLDWGQDLKRLAKWIEKNNVKNITLDYFGGSVPEYYLGDKITRWHAQYGKPPKGYFAVSATFYQNSRFYKKYFNQEDYSWLDSEKPIANIGGSILVYEIE